MPASHDFTASPTVSRAHRAKRLVSAQGAFLLETPRAERTEGAIAAVAWNTIMTSLGGMSLYFTMLAQGNRVKQAILAGRTVLCVTTGGGRRARLAG